jgi:recombinational DNA repair protein RecR
MNGEKNKIFSIQFEGMELYQYKLELSSLGLGLPLNGSVNFVEAGKSRHAVASRSIKKGIT